MPLDMLLFTKCWPYYIFKIVFYQVNLIKNWNVEISQKATSYAGGKNNPLFFFFFLYHSATTDLWNKIEVILKITRGKNNTLLLCFLWYHGFLFLMSQLNKKTKWAHAPFTTPGKNTHSLRFLLGHSDNCQSVSVEWFWSLK